MGGDDRDLLRRIVLAEAEGENLTGQALVARTILNRQQLIKQGTVSPGTFSAKSGSLHDIVYGKNQFEGANKINRNWTQSQLDMAEKAIQLANDPTKLRGLLGGLGNLIFATGFNTPAVQGTGMKGNVLGRYGGHNFIADGISRNKFSPNAVGVAGASTSGSETATNGLNLTPPPSPKIPELKAPNIKAPILDATAELKRFNGAIKDSFDEMGSLAEQETKLTVESIRQRVAAQLEAAKSWQADKNNENRELRDSLELENAKTDLIKKNALASSDEIEKKLQALQQDREMARLGEDSLAVRKQIEAVLKSSLLTEADRAAILANLAKSEAAVLSTTKEKYQLERAIADQQERQAKLQEAAQLNRERASALNDKLYDAQRQFMNPRDQIMADADRALRQQQESIREQFASQPDLMAQQLAAAQAASDSTLGIDLQLFDYEQQRQEIQGVADLISSSIGGAIQGVFDGGKDVFQNFIKQIGDGFINMAVEIIQGFVKNAIMDAFAPTPSFGGGGGGGFDGGSLIGAGLNLLTSVVPAFAQGGTVNYSTPTLALLHPGEEVLSYEKGDAQRYRAEQLMRQGTGLSMMSRSPRQSSHFNMGAATNPSHVNKTANVTINVKATDADSFRRSESSIRQNMARRSRETLNQLD